MHIEEHNDRIHHATGSSLLSLLDNLLDLISFQQYGIVRVACKVWAAFAPASVA